MSKVMYQVEVWELEKYETLEQATNDKAVDIISLDESEYDHNSFSSALSLAGKRAFNNPKHFAFKATRLLPYKVQAEVMEWNRYETVVYAKSPLDATTQVSRYGITKLFTSRGVGMGSGGF